MNSVLCEICQAILVSTCTVNDGTVAEVNRSRNSAIMHL